MSLATPPTPPVVCVHSMAAYSMAALLWVMLNWTFLNNLKDLTQMNLSFHKLVNTLQGRSKTLTLPVLQNSLLLIEWLTGLYRISRAFQEKEYKKGRKKVSEILAQTCSNVAINQ